MSEPRETIDCGSIIKAYLIEQGYDGLVSFDNECGCLLDDLMPCGGEHAMRCEPGYKVAGCSPHCGLACDFHVIVGHRPGSLKTTEGDNHAGTDKT